VLSFGRVFWEPGDKIGRVISLDESNIRLWNLDSKFSVKAAESITIAAGDKKGAAKLRTMAWNPHTANQIGTANDCALRGWDLRSLRQTWAIELAHTLAVRDLDFNPNKPHQIVSCGDDSKVKFWDVRHTDKPIRVLNRHSHWYRPPPPSPPLSLSLPFSNIRVWRTMYNRFHDQLLLSSSSDSLLNLENAVSISSVMSLPSDDEPKEAAE